MAKWSEKEAAIRALERGGKVDPNDLIEAARSEGHPCHEDFTWDVHEAACERWRDQARAIIRRCKFEVQHEDITMPVVQYIPSQDDDRTFTSLPRIRSKAKTNEIMLAELDMLLGLVARIHGIAFAKQGIIGPGVASKLSAVSRLVEECRSELDG
jgi:hypothetical protein